MSDLATVVVDRDLDTVRVTVSGEIDASNAERVRSALEEAVSGRAVTLDVSKLEYVDSAGIRAIFAVSEYAGARRCECRLVVSADAPVRRILDVAGVTSVVSFEAAL
jgi:anti-anti-sigma factor